MRSVIHDHEGLPYWFDVQTGVCEPCYEDATPMQAAQLRRNTTEAEKNRPFVNANNGYWNMKASAYIGFVKDDLLR